MTTTPATAEQLAARLLRMIDRHVPMNVADEHIATIKQLAAMAKAAEGTNYISAQQSGEAVACPDVQLHEHIDALAARHGSLRAAARVLEVDPGYLSRLRSGEKDDPGETLLRRMGLRRKVIYTAAGECATPSYCKFHGCPSLCTASGGAR